MDEGSGNGAVIDFHPANTIRRNHERADIGSCIRPGFCFPGGFRAGGSA